MISKVSSVAGLRFKGGQFVDDLWHLQQSPPNGLRNGTAPAIPAATQSNRCTLSSSGLETYLASRPLGSVKVTAPPEEEDASLN